MFALIDRQLLRDKANLTLPTLSTYNMAYSDFTAYELTKKFGIKFRAENLFPIIQPIQPSQWLLESLKRGQNLGFGSENHGQSG